MSKYINLSYKKTRLPKGQACLYVLRDPTSNEIRYLGKSVNPTARLGMHIFHAQHGENTYRARWIRKVLNDGSQPILEVLAIIGEAQWEELERFYIALLRSKGFDLVNTSAGGDGVDAPRTAEWREKIGKAHRGKTVSEEARRKLSETIIAQHPTCKNGHPWNLIDTKWVIKKNGRVSRICLICQRAHQKKMVESGEAKAYSAAYRRRKKIANSEYKPKHQRIASCKRGHTMAGDNLRIAIHNGHEEYICRECVRIRNTACKKRARALKKAIKQLPDYLFEPMPRIGILAFAG